MYQEKRRLKSKIKEGTYLLTIQKSKGLQVNINEHANKLDDLDEMKKQLERYKLPKQPQDDNLNRPITRD